ncbi:MAG TPA: hypothetical protein VEJ86_03680, partial [Candidatus Binataceae bacterium]|nr:hypothetical protein [Candidatus Binataceae bacterium]
MTHHLNDPLRHKSEILEHARNGRDPFFSLLYAQGANALSGFRFVLALTWIGVTIFREEPRSELVAV